MRTTRLLPIGLAILTVGSFADLFHHDFINYDDPAYVTANDFVKGGLTSGGIHWAFTTYTAANWHPLTWLSLMLDAELFGADSARGFLLTNLLFHVGSVLLLFGSLRSATGRIWCSAFVAAVFAIHPLRVESIAWVSERKDVLSIFFGMMTLRFYVSFVQRRRPLPYLLMTLSYLVGMFAKQTLVTLPFVLLLMDYWPFGRLSMFVASDAGDSRSRSVRGLPWRRMFSSAIEKLPLFVISGIFCVVAAHAQKEGDAVADLLAVPMLMRVYNAIYSYVAYLGMMIWPVNLSLIYPHPEYRIPTSWLVGCGVFLAGMTILVVVLGRRFPYLAVGWFWYLGTLVPMIGLVQVGMQGLADRYTYFPQIGILLMFTWGIADLADAIPSLKRFLPASGAVAVAVLAALCWRQVTFWQNSGILFERVLAMTDQNFSAYCCYGQYLYVNGKVDEALVYYEKALDVNPSYLKGQVLFADILVDKGRSDEALQRYQLALKENAQFIPARMGLGKFFLDRKMYSSAIEQFQKVLEIEPDNSEAKLKRSLALHGAGRKDETHAEILDLLKEQPKNSRLRATLGDIYAEEGKTEKAREEYEAAIRMNVREGAAYNGLGTLLARGGEFARSVEFFEKAIENEPDNPSAYDNLGSALAALGKTRDAVVQFRKALEVKEGYPASANNLAWILATHPETSLRNGQEAVELLRSLCEGEKGEDPSYLDTLAAAYAESGNFPQAVAVANRAQAIAIKGGNAELAKQIESRRKLYQANQPFRG